MSKPKNEIVAGSYNETFSVDLDRFIENVPFWFADRIISEDETSDYPLKQEYNVSVVKSAKGEYYSFGFEDAESRYSGPYATNAPYYGTIPDFGDKDVAYNNYSDRESVIALAREKVNVKSCFGTTVALPRWVYEEVLPQSYRDFRTVFPFSMERYRFYLEKQKAGTLEKDIVLVRDSINGKQELFFINNDITVPSRYCFNDWYSSFDLAEVGYPNGKVINWQKDKLAKELAYRNMIIGSIGKNKILLSKQKRKVKTPLRVPGKIGQVKKREPPQLIEEEPKSQNMEKFLTDKEIASILEQEVPASILELIPQSAKKYIHILQSSDRLYPNSKIIVDRDVWGWGKIIAVTDEEGSVVFSIDAGDVEDRRKKISRKNFADSIEKWLLEQPLFIKSKSKNKSDFIVPQAVAKYIPPEFHKDIGYYQDGLYNRITCTVNNGMADSLCFRDIHGKPVVSWSLINEDGSTNDGMVGATIQQKLEKYFEARRLSMYSTYMVNVSGTKIPEWLLNSIPEEYWHRITNLSANKEWPDQNQELYTWPFLFTNTEYNIRFRLAPPATWSQEVFVDYKAINTKEAIDKKREELEQFFSIYKEMYVTPFQKFKTEVYDKMDGSKEKTINYGGTLTSISIGDKIKGTSELFFFDRRTEMLLSHEYYNHFGMHNEAGPAAIRYSKDGSVFSKQYSIDGKTVNEYDWKQYVQNRFDSQSREGNQNLGVGSQEAVAVTGLTTGLTGIILHQTLGKTAQEVKMISKFDKVKEIAKSDAKIVAKRVAVEKISQVLQKALVEIMTANLKGKQKSTLAKNLVEFFDTEKGRAVLQFFAGVGLPMISAHIPSKYHSILEEVSTEFRIQGETTVMLEAINAVQPLVMMATSGMLDAFTSGAEEQETTQIRVHVDRHSDVQEHVEEVALTSAAAKASK